jgi:hypothetical protein
MKVTMEGGPNSFEGENATEIVESMQQEDWSQAERSQRQYMQEVAARVTGATQQPVRTSDALTFLFDLERAGVCRVEFLTPDEAKRFSELSNEGWERDERKTTISPEGEKDGTGKA